MPNLLVITSSEQFSVVPKTRVGRKTSDYFNQRTRPVRIVVTRIGSVFRYLGFVQIAFGIELKRVDVCVTVMDIGYRP